MFVRSRVRDINLMQVDLPHYRAGCNGIDLFTGGISFIKAEDLAKSMQEIMANGIAYSLELGLETMTPQVANVMKWLQDKAEKINQANMNSCETAEALVGSVWPKTEAAQKQICQDIGSDSGIFSDYASARQGCGSGGRMTEILNKGKQDSKYADLVFNNVNLVWKAMSKNAFLSKDPQLSELLMTLSGSIILKDMDGSSEPAHGIHRLPAHATDKSLLNALLRGGSAKIWHCDTTDADGCLNPTWVDLTIDPSNGLESRVRKIINDILTKIYNDSPLTNEEKGFLQATRLPVYKMLNVQSAFSKDNSIIDISDYVQVIALDILFQYLQESLEVVQTSAESLPYPIEIMDEFQKNIHTAIESARYEERSAYSQMSMSLQLVQQTQAVERMLAGQLSSSISDNLGWAKEMQ